MLQAEQLVSENQAMAEAKKREKLMAKMKDREENLQHMQNYSLGQGGGEDPQDLQRFVHQQQKNIQGADDSHTRNACKNNLVYVSLCT
jgi:hypothetical protein